MRTVGLLLPSGGRAFTGQRPHHPHDGRGLDSRLPDELERAALPRRNPPHGRGQPYDRPRQRLRHRSAGRFFDACDRYGLLVWEDLSRTSSLPLIRPCIPSPATAAIYLDNMQDCIYRLRGRPSLLVWCGSNEARRRRHRPTLAERDPARTGRHAALVAQFPQAAALGQGKDGHTERRPLLAGPSAGDISASTRKDRDHAQNEIGLASPPAVNSIFKAIPDHEQPEPAWFPLNRTLGYHDATTLFPASWTRSFAKIWASPPAWRSTCG